MDSLSPTKPACYATARRLLAAKDALQGTATLNWSVDTPISDWEGVWVQGSPRRVTGLILTSKNLTGSIPPDLGNLDALEHLRLDDNQLTGQFTSGVGQPSRIENPAHLRQSAYR